jgi:hypothetical protein
MIGGKHRPIQQSFTILCITKSLDMPQQSSVQFLPCTWSGLCATAHPTVRYKNPDSSMHHQVTSHAIRAANDSTLDSQGPCMHHSVISYTTQQHWISTLNVEWLVRGSEAQGALRGLALLRHLAQVPLLHQS